MAQPLTAISIDDGNLGNAENLSATPTMTTPAETAKAATVWKPVILRVVVGGFALLGLAGVGAASMLAGLDGARANPPAAVSTHRAVSEPDASAASASQPSVSASATVSAQLIVPTPCTMGRTPDGRVILNTATVADLRTLPGIGEKRAQAILSLREKLKKFHRLQELRRVRGIGAKSLQRLAPKLLIDAPAGTCSP